MTLTTYRTSYRYGFRWFITIFITFIMPGSQIASANQETRNGEILLVEIVAATVRIMCANGYEMPEYRVVNGHSDVPISGPREKYAFFGYLENSWMGGSQRITLHFYEADQLPKKARMRLIEYLVDLYEKKGGSFSLSLRMIRDKYKKPQIIKPDAFIELDLYQIVF